MFSKIFLTKIALVDIAVLLFGFIDTFYIYTASSYFSEVIGSDNVGFFYLVSYVGSLTLFFALQPLIRALGRTRVLYIALLGSLISITLLSHLNPSYFAAGILVFFIVTSSLIWVLLDILLESFSSDEATGSIRGLNLTLLNMGVLLAPFLSSLTLKNFGFQGIFLAMLIFYILLFLYCLLAFRKLPRVELPKIAFWHALTLMRKNVALRRAYALSFSLYFFYAVMIIYMPLYLTSLGFTWTQIGFMFTIMLLPFVFIQFPLGRLADRSLGEKEIIIVSLVIALIATLLMAITSEKNFLLWTSILFLSRIGIAGLEVMKDTYFYRQVTANDVDVIAFFRTSLPVANICVAAAATSMLAFLPLTSVFYLAAGVLCFALVVASRLVDSR